MPYSVAYKLPGMIFLRFEGLLTMQDALDATADVVQMAKEHGCFRVLTDLREATLKLSMVEVYNYPILSAEIASAAGLQVYQFKRAYVTLEGEKLLPFFENVSINRFHKVKVFYTIESAEQWLFAI